MTEFKIQMMKRLLEKNEEILSGSLEIVDRGGNGPDSEGFHEPRRTQPSETSSSEADNPNTRNNNLTLTASYLATRAPGPSQVEMWVRKFEQHESTAYLMERPLLSNSSFSPGSPNPCAEKGPEHSCSIERKHHSPTTGNPPSSKECPNSKKLRRISSDLVIGSIKTQPPMTLYPETTTTNSQPQCQQR